MLKVARFLTSFSHRLSTSIPNKMRLVALISGGKDSCYNMLQCVAAGHQIVALAHLKPKGNQEELDSFMYQTVGHKAIDLFADAMDVPLYQAVIDGTNVCKDVDYVPTSGDEVEDLYKLLEKVKREVQIEGVASGAVLSNYQRLRVEDICTRLGLSSYAYLWRRDQEELLSEMVANRMSAVVVKVAALGLDPHLHLGKEVSDLFPHFVKIKQLYGFNVCGEGGEYETFTLDCPLFHKRIIIDEQEVVIHSNDAFAPVGYLLLKRLHLEPKPGRASSQAERVKDIGVCTPSHFLLDLDLSPDTSLTNCHELSPQVLEKSVIDIDWRSSQVLSSDSGWFYISGLHIPSDATPSAAIKCALDRLKELTQLHGMNLEEIMLVQLLVKDMKDFAEFNSVYKTYFNRNPPSRVCVQIPLPNNVSAVINCIGYKKSMEDVQVEHMHVQSVSHWAPANIGPYSQAVKLTGNLVFVSGQIGLVPSTMQLVNGGATAESTLSLRHVRRVLAAISPDCDLSSVIFCLCYVTHQRFVSIVKRDWAKYTKSESETDSSPGILNCVVVPALPRGASVEWQVVAIDRHPIGSKWHNLADVVINKVLIRTILNKFSFEEQTQGCFIAKCLTTEYVVDETVLVEILDHLKKVVTMDVNAAATNFQVYYSNSVINYATILKVQKTLSHLKVTFSFVPVQQLDQSSCFILVFGQFT